MESVHVFFFQAEAGIRDIGVTGVQACALPIFGERAVAALGRRPERFARWNGAAAWSSEREVFLAQLREPARARASVQLDRKSVAEGKSVELGGRRSIKKKN